MDAESFADLVAGFNEDYLCEYLQVNPKTLKRWNAGTVQPPHAVLLLLQLRAGDLSALGGSGWEGFRISPDNKLHIPFFHRPFEPGQVKAMFFTTQDAWADRSEVKGLQRDLVALRAELTAEKEKAAWYRRQLKETSLHYSLFRSDLT